MFQDRKECYWVKNHRREANRHQKKNYKQRSHVLARALVARNEVVQRIAPPLLSLARQEEDKRADF
jgi:hypothetical protein